jgi:hypothetical protein
MIRSSDANKYLWKLHRHAMPTVQELYYKLSSLLEELSKVSNTLFTSEEWDALKHLVRFTTQSLTPEAMHELIKHFLRIESTSKLSTEEFGKRVDEIRIIYSSIGVDVASLDAGNDRPNVNKNDFSKIFLLRESERKAMNLNEVEINDVFKEHIKEFRKLYNIKHARLEDFNSEEVLLFNDYYADLAAGFYFLPDNDYLYKFFNDPENAILAGFRYNICTVCGKPADDSHHMDVDRQKGIKDTDKRLMRVCRIHHEKIHQYGTNNFLDASGLEESSLKAGDILTALGDNKGEAIHILGNLNG